MDSDRAVIFTIRYSVLLRQSGFVRIGRDVPFEEYLARLFDPHRLEVHHHLFSTYTLPSLDAAIANATDARVGVYVLVSDELPADARGKLDASLASRPWAKTVPVDAGEAMPHRQCVLDFLQSGRFGVCAYAHCRLDDDDMVANQFVNILSPYVRLPLAGFHVSLGLGYSAIYDHARRRISSLLVSHSPKVAIGFALIGSYDPEVNRTYEHVASAHEVGSHATADLRAPVIIDSRRPAFIRTLYPEQDTEGLTVSLDGKKAAYRETVARHFAVDVGSLPTRTQSEVVRDEMLLRRQMR